MTVCARTKRASGIYRIHPFFLFYSVHPLYDHRASRVYIILYYFPWNWRTQRAHAHFKSRDNSPIILVFLFLYTKQIFVEYRSNNLSIILFFQRNEYRFAPPFFFLRIFVHYFSLKSHVMLLIETKRIFASLECRTWCTRIIKVSAEWSYV